MLALFRKNTLSLFRKKFTTHYVSVGCSNTTDRKQIARKLRKRPAGGRRGGWTPAWSQARRKEVGVCPLR